MRNFPTQFLFVLLTAAASLFGKELHIVVLGSSTAAGIGPKDVEQSWVNLYEDYLEQNTKVSIKITNLAKQGYSTYHILPSDCEDKKNRPAPNPNRNITQALSLNPSAIIINLPSNDAGKGYSVEEQISNYKKILSNAKIYGVPVWLTTTQPRNLNEPNRNNLQEMRDSTLVLFKERAIDFWGDLALSDGKIHPVFDSGDGIHLNEWGHRVLVEKVWEAKIHEYIMQ